MAGRDPDTGVPDIGHYRFEIIDKQTMSFLAMPNHRFGKNLAKGVALGHNTFRAALVIGVDPMLAYTGPIQVPDAKQALGIMLTCSKLALPKIAMVFDEDIDIWDDNAVQFAMAFRYMPHLDTIVIPGCNTMTVDPMIGDDVAPGTASNLGMDCTIPLGPQFERSHFDRCTVFVLGDPPPDVVPMTEDELTADMAALIGDAPRTWKEILQHFNGQPYPTIYRALSNLRPRLGRCDDAPWYRYTFSDSDFAVDAPQPAMSNFDPRHGV